MLDTMKQLIEQQQLNVYALAEITDAGTKTLQVQPANACNNSYSVAKVFTATAIGMLQDAGKLDVHDLVFPLLKQAFPSDYDRNWEKVTIEHALTHQIGFDQGFLDIDTEDIHTYGTSDFLNVVLSRRLPFEPGTRRVYSDAAYYLLSRILTAIAGETLDRFLQQRLFTPLRFQEVAWSNCPEGYPMGATGLYIRTEDMAKLGWTYLNKGIYQGRRIVSEAWVEQALACGYELARQDAGHAFAKGGMHGQLLHISFDARRVVAAHGYTPRGIGAVNALLNQS